MDSSEGPKNRMRRFHLQRTQDVSGVSGLGKVAEGCEFSNGMCALTFLSPMQCINIYANIKTVEVFMGMKAKPKSSGTTRGDNHGRPTVGRP